MSANYQGVTDPACLHRGPGAMGDVVNINQYRKARKRAAEKRQGAANRSKFGRSKGRNRSEDLETERQRQNVERSRLDNPSTQD